MVDFILVDDPTNPGFAAFEMAFPPDAGTRFWGEILKPVNANSASPLMTFAEETGDIVVLNGAPSQDIVSVTYTALDNSLRFIKVDYLFSVLKTVLGSADNFIINVLDRNDLVVGTAELHHSSNVLSLTFSGFVIVQSVALADEHILTIACDNQSGDDLTFVAASGGFQTQIVTTDMGSV